MANINTAFDIGSRAYLINYANVRIMPVEVLDVVTLDGSIRYKILYLYSPIKRITTGVPESSLYTWNNAKAALQAYLAAQTATLSVLQEPA